MMNNRTLILIAVAAGIAGAILYALKRASKAVDKVADDIAAPIADAIIAATLPPNVIALGGVVLPDGSAVTWDAIVQAGSRLSSEGTFVWRGVKYRVTGRRPDGVFGSVKA